MGKSKRPFQIVFTSVTAHGASLPPEEGRSSSSPGTILTPSNARSANLKFVDGVARTRNGRRTTNRMKEEERAGGKVIGREKREREKNRDGKRFLWQRLLEPNHTGFGEGVRVWLRVPTLVHHNDHQPSSPPRRWNNYPITKFSPADNKGLIKTRWSAFIPRPGHRMTSDIVVVSSSTILWDP